MKSALGKLTLTVVVVGLVIPLVMTGFANQAEARTLKWSHSGPPVGVHPTAQKWMAKEITRRTNGEIEFEFYWSASLIPVRDTVSGVGKGIADIASPGMSMFTIGQNPHWSSVLLGFTDNYWAAQMAGYEAMTTNPYILAEFDKHNVVPTHGYVAGTDLNIFKERVTTLKEMKGKRFRCFGPVTTLMVKEVGMVPVSTPLWDVYDALGKGVIDGAWGAVNHYHSLKWYEVAKHASIRHPKTLCGDCTTLINKDTWNSLSQSTRNIIKEVASEYNDYYVQLIVEAEDSWIKEIKAAGANFHEYSPEVNDAYRAATKKALEEWFEKYDSKGNHTREVYEQVAAALRKYEKEVAEKGYPWER